MRPSRQRDGVRRRAVVDFGVSRHVVVGIDDELSAVKFKRNVGRASALCGKRPVPERIQARAATADSVLGIGIATRSECQTAGTDRPRAGARVLTGVVAAPAAIEPYPRVALILAGHIIRASVRYLVHLDYSALSPVGFRITVEEFRASASGVYFTHLEDGPGSHLRRNASPAISPVAAAHIGVAIPSYAIYIIFDLHDLRGVGDALLRVQSDPVEVDLIRPECRSRSCKRLFGGVTGLNSRHPRSGICHADVSAPVERPRVRKVRSRQAALEIHIVVCSAGQYGRYAVLAFHGAVENVVDVRRRRYVRHSRELVSGDVRDRRDARRIEDDLLPPSR